MRRILDRGRRSLAVDQGHTSMTIRSAREGKRLVASSMRRRRVEVLNRGMSKRRKVAAAYTSESILAGLKSQTWISTEGERELSAIIWIILNVRLLRGD